MKTLAHPALCLLLPLVGVNLLALAIRVLGDNAGVQIKPYMATFYSDTLVALGKAPWWSVLLPIKEFGGRWGTTGFLLVHWLEGQLGEPGAFLLLTIAMVSTGLILTYLTFGSTVLASLVGIALATTTFNYHTYSVPGGVIMLPLVTFLFLFAFAQVRWINAVGHSHWWGAVTIIACLSFALSYEGWLDFVPLAWVLFPSLAWHYHRIGDHLRSTRCAILLALITLVAAGYIVVKVKSGLDGLHPRGGEADLLFTYGTQYLVLMFEDVVSSYFTFFYTTITTYFPPELLSFSVSSWVYGPDRVMALQEGYHPNANHLVRYNHLFLWRYYAGVFLVIAVFYYIRVAREFFSTNDKHYLILFVLLTCTLIGSPTHLLIKWRPMHAAPFLGYQCYLSIMGFTLLLCYVVHWKSVDWGGLRGAALLAVLIFNFLYCAYARPSLLSHMSQESFLAAYPDPRSNLAPRVLIERLRAW